MKRIDALLVGSIAVLALVAGCGGDDDDEISGDSRSADLVHELEATGAEDVDAAEVAAIAQEFCQVLGTTGDIAIAEDMIFAKYPDVPGQEEGVFAKTASLIYCPLVAWTLPTPDPIIPLEPGDEYVDDPNKNVGPDGLCYAYPCGSNGTPTCVGLNLPASMCGPDGIYRP